MFKSVEYTKLSRLEEIWHQFEGPLIVNFWYAGSPLSIRATELLFETNKKLTQVRLLFIAVEVKDVEAFIDEYQFGKFPAVLVYDYNNEICRFSSWKDLHDQLELKCKELSVGNNANRS